jgi:glycosyltransferase involved in cell wall biosynthesis
MRIAIITAGTGSFYCGTCMRDNALAVELRNLGHDAILLPLYLPPALDEPSAAEGAPVFYGGINVYLQQTSALFRKTPRWIDRLLDSPTMLRMAAKRAGMTQPEDLGELTLSTLRGEEGNQAKELARLVEWLRDEFKPDVVCLSNAILIGLADAIKEQTGAAVYCCLQGEDTFLDSLPEPHKTAAWKTLSDRARRLDGLIAVSRYHAELMTKRAELPPGRVHVVYNGIRLDGLEPRESLPDPPVIGYLARMCAAKGLDTLVSAVIELRGRGGAPRARLRVAGTMTEADAPFVAEQKSRLEAAGLAGEAEFLANITRDDKLAFLRGLTVLSVPATYGESFGLYLIEAWGAGVPVVQPRHAAFPELIAVSGAGLLCEPDDPDSLADGLAALIADPSRNADMGRRGRAAVEKQFTAEAMARGVLAVIGARKGGKK